MVDKVGMDVDRIQQKLTHQSSFNPGIQCPHCESMDCQFGQRYPEGLAFHCLECNWYRLFPNWRQKEKIVILPRAVCSDCGSDKMVNSNTESWECVFCQ